MKKNEAEKEASVRKKKPRRWGRFQGEAEKGELLNEYRISVWQGGKVLETYFTTM